MDTISEAINKGDFPAKPSHYCEWCSYTNRCPIEVKVSTPEELAARVLVLEATLKDSKSRLKTLVEKQGPASINNEVFDFYPQETEIYPTAEFIGILTENKVENPLIFLKVDNEEAKHLEPQILEKLMPLAESKVSTRFSHKRRQE